ncbi:Gamma-glutamyl hydrolase [Eumeta japonica]|uniref:Gamma-glutamyl hydrolase n=1 Tax=Eumeta variegata TaxID=151549 RepID=A0A4C1YKY5_EUMVA|nr:Gamma-glutamyl hydrolase [Eumeta japonica]
MFAQAPSEVIDVLATENVTINAHQFCIDDDNLRAYNLTEDWRVMSYNHDDYGVKFISTVEHTRQLSIDSLNSHGKTRHPCLTPLQLSSKQSAYAPFILTQALEPLHRDRNASINTQSIFARYPFYGVQFHPEKNSFEWKASKAHAHSMNAVRSNRYFMDFFVSECRKSEHSFASASEENQYVIYNYEAKFTGVLGSAFHQCYMFEPRGTVSNASSSRTRAVLGYEGALAQAEAGSLGRQRRGPQCPEPRSLGFWTHRTLALSR